LSAPPRRRPPPYGLLLIDPPGDCPPGPVYALLLSTGMARTTWTVARMMVMMEEREGMVGIGSNVLRMDSIVF
jgi:hypothetical protein